MSKYLLREGVLAHDPTAQLESPKLGRPLPRSLTEVQVARLLAAPDAATPLGLRDRAMLETLYATGLRVSELVGLTLQQANLQAGVVKVIGKGDKERLVPLGEEAVTWLPRYLREARPELLRSRSTDVLFPTECGAAMTRQPFWYNIKRHARTAGIETGLSPHTLRHAFATHARITTLVSLSGIERSPNSAPVADPASRTVIATTSGMLRRYRFMSGKAPRASCQQ